MFNNRKERGELLETLLICNKDATVPHFPQVYYSFYYSLQLSIILFPSWLHYASLLFISRKDKLLWYHFLLFLFLQMIHLLWGEFDRIFDMEIAQNMKEYVWSCLSMNDIFRWIVTHHPFNIFWQMIEKLLVILNLSANHLMPRQKIMVKKILINNIMYMY